MSEDKPEIRALGVARTMAEAGVLCPACTHPVGRHEFELGCIATMSSRTPSPCACLFRPDGPLPARP